MNYYRKTYWINALLTAALFLILHFAFYFFMSEKEAFDWTNEIIKSILFGLLLALIIRPGRFGYKK